VLAAGRLRTVLAMLGPAFVVAVAYVDPGNIAANVQSGAQYGYRMLWVVLIANLLAMPVQYLAAKIGIVTGRPMPQVCRDCFARPVLWGLWVQAEIVVMPPTWLSSLAP
jgi:manganese transport protein